MTFAKIKSQINIIVCLVVNFICSIALIQINKYIYVYYKYPNIALTCIHFGITFIGLLVCLKLQIFKYKHVAIIKMLPMAFSFCGFVVLANYSLQFNTIGTYQCFKALTTPLVVVITTLFYGIQYSFKVKLSVVPVCIGIFFNSMFDLRFNLIGTIFGLVGAMITTVYQVAPLSGLLLLLIIPIFEPLTGANGALDFKRPLEEWIVIALSGILAFVVNISIFWLIGATSALTYNMSGYIKFVSIIIVGFIIFKDPIKYQQIASISLVLLGLGIYSYFRLKETQENTLVEEKNLETIENQIHHRHQSASSSKHQSRLKSSSSSNLPNQTNV